jgi:hypothetical protein
MVMAGSAANAGVARMRRDKIFFIDLSDSLQMKILHLRSTTRATV